MKRYIAASLLFVATLLSAQQGPMGPRGFTGARGPSGTAVIGTVTTVDPGTPASVTNVGTSSTATLNFSIPRGSQIYSGAGAPSSGTGGNGDFYLNTTTACFYGPKASGAWPGTCVGFAGPTGPSGPAGPTGTVAILTGTGAPSLTCSGSVNFKVLYADNSTHYLYYCDGTTWQNLTSGSAVWGGITGTLASQTDLASALNAKAPINSPTLTGTPLSPTHGACASDTQIANGTYVANCGGGANGVQYPLATTNYVIWSDSRGVVSDTCYMSNAPSDGVTISSGSISGGVLTAVTTTNYYASPTTVSLSGFTGAALGLNGQIVNLITMSSTGFTANVTGITTLGSTGTGFSGCAYNLSGNMRRDQYFNGHGTIINQTTAALDTPAAVSQYTAKVHPYSPAVTGNPAYLIIQVGTQNWIEAGWSLSNAESDITSLLTSAKTDGYKVIMTTQIPHASNIYSPALSQLQLLQTWTRAQGPTQANIAAGAYWDYLVDMALYLPDPSDSRFFIQSGAEAGHLTDLGAKVFADALNASMSLQTSLPVAPPLAAPASFSSTAGVVCNSDTTTSANCTSANISAILVCADTSGSGTAQSCTTSPSFTPVAGSVIFYTTTTANTGTGLTINVNSIGAKPVAKWQGSTTLALNDLRNGKRTLMTYDGTNWEMSTIGNDPAGSTGMPAPIFGTGNPYGLSTPAIVNRTNAANTFTATSGNKIIVWWNSWDNNDSTLPTITDTLGTAFGAPVATLHLGSGYRKIWMGTLTSSGTDAVSITGGVAHHAWNVLEVSNISSTQDGWNSGTTSTQSLTTTTANDLLLSLYQEGGSACPTISSGWSVSSTCYRDNGWNTAALGTQVSTTAGTYSVTWTGSTVNWVDVIAFKASAIPVAGSEGQLYFDTTTTPYTKYLYHSGAWALFPDNVGAWTNISGTITPTNMTCTASSCTATTQSTITFGGIPATATSLVIDFNIAGSTTLALRCTMNGDTASTSYASIGNEIQASANNVVNSISQTSIYCGVGTALVSAGSLRVPFYAITTRPRTMIVNAAGIASQSSGTNNFNDVLTGLWNNTAAAVSSITITTSTGTLSGSFSIYAVQ